MRSDRFQLVATAIFALGFVLAGSGWSFVLSSVMNNRPSWSVCGQEMCSCVKPTAEQLACPLCDGSAGQTALIGSCTTDLAESEPEQSPTRRVPKNNKSVEALGGAGTNIAVAFFVGTMMGRVETTGFADADRVVHVATNDRAPRSRGLALPTPPPRA